MKYIIVSILLIVSIQAYGQITVNTNFLPNIAAPMDLRYKIATLADTSTITFPYLGAIAYVTSKDSVFYLGVNGWKPIGKGLSVSGVNPIDSTVVSAGTGISVVQSPANTFTVTNTSPDQTVSITGAGITSITGTYPNFTATSTEVDGLTNNEGILTVGAGTGTTSIINSNTSGSAGVTIAAGTGLGITESGNVITLTNSSPNVTTDLTITGASSPYTINSSDGTDVTVAQGTGIAITRSTNQISIANSAPDQTVTIAGATGTYPNFTIVPESTTVTDGTTIDLTKTTYDITAEVKSNSIDSTHIKTNGIGTTDIADGVVKFAKLQNSGVTASTYNNVTVNNKGIVTSGSNVSYLTVEVDGSTTNEKINSISWNDAQDSLQVIENGIIYRTKITGFLTETDTTLINQLISDSLATYVFETDTLLINQLISDSLVDKGGSIIFIEGDSLYTVIGSDTTTVGYLYQGAVYFLGTPYDIKKGDFYKYTNLFNPTATKNQIWDGSAWIDFDKDIYLDNELTTYHTDSIPILPKKGDLWYNPNIIPAQLQIHTGSGWVNVRTTDLTITGASSPYTINSSDGTDVTVAQGTGIGLSRSSNQLTITNTAPDQVVTISGATGTYPNFTVVPESTTVTDGTTIDLTKTTYDITAEVKSNSIDSTHIKTSGIGTTDIADGVVKFAKLQNSGVTASTYNNVTVNNKGIVTNGSNVSYLTTEVDGSVTNERQDLSLSGNTLSLSSDATTVNLAPYLDNVTTNLSVTGTSSPLTLNSSDGTDVTITAGTNVTLSGSSGNITINATDTNSGGTVTSVNGTGGTGISVTGGPITNSGSLTITNTAPDQVVTITGATGTYPNFTLPTYDDGQTLTLLDSINRVFRLAISGGNTVSFKDQGITTEVDGLVDNEGKLSVGIGGANSSSIQSNSFGSNTITIAGSGGIGVSETGNTITLVNNIADSTIVSAGYGIDVSEFPTNTYTVKADTAEVATPYDLTLKQNTLVSGTNIKTVNGNSLLGSGNVSISTIDSTAYFDPYIIGSDTVGVILQESQDTVHFITTESTVVPESTTVSDSGTIDLTKTGYDISGVVVDGSITPAKLDRAYLTAYTENDPTIASQSGNNGKYLTTNGTTTSWATVVNGTADSTTVVNSYGTIITESPANQFNVKVDSTKFATAYDISQKQDLLISGTNIKTVNGTSLLGSGNIAVGGTTHWASLNYGSSLYGNTQTLTADANTTINFLGSSESSSSVIDANHSNDEIEFVEAGTYRIDYKVNFSANADGLIYANVYSSTLADYITPLKYEGETDSGYKNTIMATSYIYTATAGEKIKLQVYPIGVTHTSANIQAYFIVTKL